MIRKINLASNSGGRRSGWRIKAAVTAFLAIFALTLLVPLLQAPTPVRAQAAGSTDPIEAAKIYEAYWGFWWCSEQSEWEGGRDIGNLQRSDVFRMRSSRGDNPSYRPTFIRSDANARQTCHEESQVSPLLEEMGVDPVAYFTREHQTPNGSYRIYSITGNNTYDLNGGSGASDKNTRLALLAWLINQAHPDINLAATTLPDAQQYFILKAHLFAECVDATSSQGGDGGFREVATVSVDGTRSTSYVHVRGNSYDVAYGVGDTPANDRWQGTNMSCDEMLDEMNRLADSAALAITQWTQNNPGETIDDPGAGGEPEDDACDSSSGAFAWILCPALKLLDGGLAWMDRAINNLLNINRGIYSEDGNNMYTVWVSLRNISYAILIPIMLVMVIGTALGFEAFSAYTVKKALPRMVAAIVFITLSWYIVTFLIEFTNVIGAGILGLITGPFTETAGGSLTLSSIFGTDGGITTTLFGSGTVVVGLAIIAWLFLGTILLTALVALLVLVLRQIFIVALMLAAPLAILAWIFPGNDKLWKYWWDSFWKLLMMYPMIMAVIAVGRVFAVVIIDSGLGPLGLSGVDDTLKGILAIIAYVIPYAFIPFTFRLAGGLFATLTGMVNDKSKGLFDKQKEGRAHKMERAGRTVLQKRANFADRMAGQASKRGFVGKNLARGAGKIAAGYNIEAGMSAKRAQVGKELNDEIATGRDDAIRGLTATASMDYARKYGAKKAIADGYMKEAADGTRSYRSLGGAYVREAAVLEGKKRWGNDRFAQQAALSYEMKKASTEGEVEGLQKNYGDWVQSSGMTDSEAAGVWIGAGFENQNKHLAFKHTKWKGGAAGLETDHGKLASEAYENRGSYNMAQMNANTIKQLRRGYGQEVLRAQESQNVINTGQIFDKKLNGGKGAMRAADTNDIATARANINDSNAKQREYQAVAETFMSRFGGGGGNMVEVDGSPVPAGAPSTGGGGRAAYQTNTPGAGHVAEEARAFAVETGVYTDLAKGTDSNSGSASGTNPYGQGTAPPGGADHTRQN